MLGRALNASLRLRTACCVPLSATNTGVPRRTRTTVVADADQTSISSAHIRPFEEIPGPSSIPLLGNTWRFFKGIGGKKASPSPRNPSTGRGVTQRTASNSRDRKSSSSSSRSLSNRSVRKSLGTLSKFIGSGHMTSNYKPSSSGQQTPIRSSGQQTPIRSSGYHTPVKSSGHHTPVKSYAHPTSNRSSRHLVHNKRSGHQTPTKTSGYGLHRPNSRPSFGGKSPTSKTKPPKTSKPSVADKCSQTPAPYINDEHLLAVINSEPAESHQALLLKRKKSLERSFSDPVPEVKEKKESQAKDNKVSFESKSHVIQDTKKPDSTELERKIRETIAEVENWPNILPKKKSDSEFLLSENTGNKDLRISDTEIKTPGDIIERITTHEKREHFDNEIPINTINKLMSDKLQDDDHQNIICVSSASILDNRREQGTQFQDIENKLDIFASEIKMKEAEETERKEQMVQKENKFSKSDVTPESLTKCNLDKLDYGKRKGSSSDSEWSVILNEEKSNEAQIISNEMKKELIISATVIRKNKESERTDPTKKQKRAFSTSDVIPDTFNKNSSDDILHKKNKNDASVSKWSTVIVRPDSSSEEVQDERNNNTSSAGNWSTVIVRKLSDKEVHKNFNKKENTKKSISNSPDTYHVERMAYEESGPFKKKYSGSSQNRNSFSKNTITQKITKIDSPPTNVNMKQSSQPYRYGKEIPLPKEQSADTTEISTPSISDLEQKILDSQMKARRVPTLVTEQQGCCSNEKDIQRRNTLNSFDLAVPSTSKSKPSLENIAAVEQDSSSSIHYQYPNIEADESLWYEFDDKSNRDLETIFSATTSECNSPMAKKVPSAENRQSMVSKFVAVVDLNKSTLSNKNLSAREVKSKSLSTASRSQFSSAMDLQAFPKNTSSRKTIGSRESKESKYENALDYESSDVGEDPTFKKRSREDSFPKISFVSNESKHIMKKKSRFDESDRNILFSESLKSRKTIPSKKFIIVESEVKSTSSFTEKENDEMSTKSFSRKDLRKRLSDSSTTCYRNYGDLDIIQLQNQLHKEFGDIVRVSGLIGRKDQVWLFDPRHVETVLRNEGRTPLRDAVQILHYYRTVLRKDRFESTAGTITSQGEEWKWFRSKVNHPMMHPSSARRYFKPINDISQEFIEKIKNSRDSNLELPADFMNEFFKWSIESIAAIALDTRLGCLSYDLPKDSEPQRLIDAVHVVIDSIYELDIRQSFYRYISTPGWRRFVKAMDMFHDVAEKYIKLAMKRSPVEIKDTHSMLHRLLAEGPVVANVMTTDMLFGGVDTTSNASVALLFYLAKNPEAQKKLAEEVRRMLPESPRQPITAEIFDSMPYLKACLKESLRLSPITPMNFRTTPSDLVLGGYLVPKQTDIFMGHPVMCAKEQYFPRPLSFEPERWLRDGGRFFPTHPFASLPFGFGPRTCVGRRFAELEILTLVAKMVRNFKVEYHHGDELKSRYTVINNVDIPLKFRLIERESC